MSNSNRVEAVYRRDFIQDIAAKNEAIGRAYWRRENILLAPLMLAYLIVGCLFVVMADAFLAPVLAGAQLPLRLALSVLFGGLLAYVINGLWYDSAWNLVVRQGLVSGGAGGDIRVRMDDAGVQWTATDSEVFLAWSGVERIALRDTAVVFLNTPDTYYIPRDAFGTDADLITILERDVFPRLLTKARDLTERDSGIRALMRKPEPKAVKVKEPKLRKSKKDKAVAVGLTPADPSALDPSVMTDVAPPLDPALPTFDAAEFTSAAPVSSDPFAPVLGALSDRDVADAAVDRETTAVGPSKPVERRGFFGRAKKITAAPSAVPPRPDFAVEPVSAATPVETFAALENPFAALPVDQPHDAGSTAALEIPELRPEPVETHTKPPVFGKLGSPRAPNLRSPSLVPRSSNVLAKPAADRPVQSDFAGFVDDIPPPPARDTADWPEMSPLLDEPPFMAKAGRPAGMPKAGPVAAPVEPALSFDTFDMPPFDAPPPAHRAPMPAPPPLPPPSKASSMFWPAPVSAWPSLSNRRSQIEAAEPASVPAHRGPIEDEFVETRDEAISSDSDGPGDRAQDVCVHAESPPDPGYWRLGKRKIRGRIRRSETSDLADEWPAQ